MALWSETDPHSAHLTSASLLTDRTTNHRDSAATVWSGSLSPTAASGRRARSVGSPEPSGPELGPVELRRPDWPIGSIIDEGGTAPDLCIVG
jgi:hypothetical protein